MTFYSRGARSLSHGFTKRLANLFTPSKPSPPPTASCDTHLAAMLRTAGRKLCQLCLLFRFPLRRRRPKTPKVTIHRRGAANGGGGGDGSPAPAPESARRVRVATFNAGMFLMAPAVPGGSSAAVDPVDLDVRGKSANDRPRGILKQQGFSKSNRRVSINLPEDEISAERSRQLDPKREEKGKAPVGRSRSFSVSNLWSDSELEMPRSLRSVMDVLRDVGADVIALQNVKADEEKGMKPLSDLAEGLGMKYVFAESWAPEYGNAILSKWPIKRWRVQKIFDDSDIRNVLKATIDIPRAGEVELHCTHLDHLDENWRLKQISAILRSSEGPHLLAGGLNSLDETDYSADRWNDIVQYYEEIGKPTPKVEVMKYLKGKQYSDAKNFAGECEAVVVVAKGQDVQGTCKYGTRVDYILASPNSPYKFVPGTYGVVSSKGTSDHHIVKVDMVIAKTIDSNSSRRKQKHRVVRVDNHSFKGIWKTNS